MELGNDVCFQRAGSASMYYFCYLSGIVFLRIRSSWCPNLGSSHPRYPFFPPHYPYKTRAFEDSMCHPFKLILCYTLKIIGFLLK